MRSPYLFLQLFVDYLIRVMSSLSGLKYVCAQSLFLVAFLSSFGWYLFWVVMAPVEKDIAHIINWYFFMKLQLDEVHDVYGTLATVHHWIPLLVLSLAMLAKLSPVFSAAISRLAQVIYVTIIMYNTLLLLYLLLAGGKVTSLFSLTLPLRLALSLGPWITSLLLPHKLFIPLSILITAHFIFNRRPRMDTRSKIGTDRLCTRTYKCSLLSIGSLLVVSFISWWIMHQGCEPCSPFNTHPPPHPRLIAHRGCSENSPENSLAAFERAADIPLIHGLETDVQISSDGVAFLMHDPHLVRTTDIRDKCPTVHSLINASNLSYTSGQCPLKELNIGSWFNEKSPNAENSLRSLFASQTVPTFSDYLLIAKRTGKIVIFDVLEPPVGHTHHSHYLNITLEAIVQSGIELNKVWWLAKHNRPWVIEHHPKLTHITKTKDTPFEQLELNHIERINDDWTTSLHQFRQYQAANISINIFFVDSPLMYNYAWCVGAQTVTTDNCEELAAVSTNQLYQVCNGWYREMFLASSLTWWTGLTIGLLLALALIACDKFKVKIIR